MQGYQQQLIVFSLFISIIYAKLTINSFEALAPITIITAPPTIYATHVQLWANVIDCPKNNCSCEVYTDKLGDNAQILTFMENKQDIGFVTIPNLEPNTLYEFTLNCKTNTDSATEKRNVTTDHGRPLAPQNVAAILVSKHIKISWSPPSMLESFSYYKIIIDNNPISTNIWKNVTSYEMTDDYKYGIMHTISVITCYINIQQHPVCSKPADSTTKFFEPTAATATTTTTTATATPIVTQTSTATIVSSTKSIGVHSYHISVCMIIFSLFLSSKIKY
ncbi:unnamed protein product [Rotaria sp. Silwood2]|nr:unnamed protein product [Rotaria sp. Silwood2]CAF3231424.1 unnamed protein product [Rotaria sp. Silwood2]CAF4383216.1 unnamed protein product [Rotaria sp. Silwood2]CAF4622886.1 unnamed protein product [Rotaria sp. Silwood2]